MRKYLAEMIGTMVLVLMGCGSAVFAGNAAAEGGAGVGTLGVALAFGLAVVAMAYTIGGVSGCHINPAVTFGMYADKRISLTDLFGYWIGQFIGGIIAALPSRFGIATYAPQLDQHGNSVRGTLAFERFSGDFALHMLDGLEPIDLERRAEELVRIP